MRRWIIAGLLALSAGVGLAGGISPVEAAWMKLSDSSNQCEDVFDYFPNGGMRIFWCHASGLVTNAEIALSAGMPIWVSGPHSAEQLDLNNPGDFGHYNPQFVKWMGDHLIPGETDAAFRARTQDTYDRAVAPLARIAWLTHLKLVAYNGCALAEERGYQAAIAAARDGGAGVDYERWFFFMNPGFCDHANDPDLLFNQGFDGGVDGNVVKTTVGFWLRRRMDGTEDEFVAGLTRLLKTYDAAWLAKAKLPEPEKAQPAPKKKKGKKGKK